MKRSHRVGFALSLFMLVTPAARADEVTAWSQMLFQAGLISAASPIVMTRSAAIVHAAMFDAINGIDRRYSPVHVDPSGPSAASRDAAAAQAAYTALVALFPNQKGLLDTKLAVSMAALRGRESIGAITAGQTWGQTVANAILAWRGMDGFTPAPAPYFGTASLGAWRATPPANLPYAGLQFGTMTPWVMLSPSQFRPAGPPALGSAKYAAEFNEVKNIGRGSSTLRTPDQTVYSFFWNTSTAPYLWNNVALTLMEDGERGHGDWDDDSSRGRRHSLLSNARLLALLNMAMADAVIGCWDAKDAYQFWRPVTAIVEASADGNPGTEADATWTPLFATPAHPEYPSGHSCVSAAAAAVLAESFGERPRIDVTSDAMPGVVRSFRSFSAALTEVKNARIFAGIHFRSATNDGQALGAAVGEYVLEHALRRMH
jgi:hypothetical protein